MTTIQLNESGEQIANRLRLTLTCISELRGTYPDIPLPDDVDREALGGEAFFVTLPIGQAGARSRNQRTYSRAAVEQMVAQINTRRPEGAWGHVAPDEAGTRYDPPAIRWLAASIDSEGVAWGKGLPLTEATREYYRLAKATNARVGTSLVAWAQMDGDEVKALELVTVDLADPARVGVPITAAHAHISQEMRDAAVGAHGSAPTLEINPSVGAQHAALSPDAAPETGVLAPLPEIGEGQGMGSVLAELLGAGDPLVLVRDLLAERDFLRDSLLRVAVERAVRLPSAVGLVEELVRTRDPLTVDEIDAAIMDVIGSAAVQTVLRASLVESMGAAQRRPVARDGESSGFFEF